MILISKKEAFQLRNMGMEKNVLMSHTKHPKYYIDHSAAAMLALKELRMEEK